MVSLRSMSTPLGRQAPQFALPDPAGDIHDLRSFERPVLVVAFVCNHCHYVQHMADALGSIVRHRKLGEADVVAINSNDPTQHPEDAAPAMVDFARDHGWTFPYLIDAEQVVALAYNALCTPDLFVFDANRRLQYHGQFDDTRPNRGEASGADLVGAVHLIATTGRGPEAQTPSLGCNIKWLPGREPEYYLDARADRERERSGGGSA